MNYKITCHLMPYELDYALLSFIQLKKSFPYINKTDKIFIDVTLNLSNYIFDWEQSNITKQFFIDKFNHLKFLLTDYEVRYQIYDEDKLFGGLDTIRYATEDHIDYYIILNPDMYFNEHSLFYLIEASKQIHNKYFVVNLQIPKLWDSSWDEISDANYKNIPYNQWQTLDTYRVQHTYENTANDIQLKEIKNPKWAGWFDLYSKDVWLDFWTYHTDWNGYGACDTYTLYLAQYAIQMNLDFKQYMLSGLYTYPYWMNSETKGFCEYYKNTLTFNPIPNQRDAFDMNMQSYLEKGIQHLKQKNQK
jgi:hypothetical protein